MIEQRNQRTTAGGADVATFYGPRGLTERILAAVRAAVAEPVTPDDLVGLDHFHSAGLASTRALAEAAGVTPQMRVLDVGAGLAGPARWLAAHVGCHVTALDLTPEFCRAAEALTEVTGLGHLVEVREGDALRMPFGDATFDLAFAQNAFMNIEDKHGLFAEIRRVLHPGGVLAFQEITAGPNQPIHFPVPWAGGPEQNFLAPAEAYREALERAGFEVQVWENIGAWARGLDEVPDPHGLGLDVWVDDLEPKLENLGRNSREGRQLLWRAVCRTL